MATKTDNKQTQEEMWREVDKAIQTALKITTPKPCMECGQPTKGSRGAAGYFWARLCQPCKDEADAIVSGVVYQQGVMARALDTVVQGVPFA